MAYIFPISPVDGELYPNPAIAGSLQYIWNQGQNAWLIYSPLGVQSVSGLLPIVVTNNTDNPVVSILPATISTPGSLSAADKLKLDGLPSSFGTVTSVSASNGLTTSLPGGGAITSSGTILLKPPSGSTIGGVKAGTNITIAADGTISSADVGVKSLTASNGIIAFPNPIVDIGTIGLLPSTRTTIGGVIVGNGINVDASGVISIPGDILTNGFAAWANVQVNNVSPPTFTLKEGYNIGSVAWVGGPNPKVQVNFTSALQDANYGVNATANSPDYAAAGTQSATTINYGLKTSVFVQLKAVSVFTSTSSVTGGTIEWNAWGPGGPPGGGQAFNEFDLQIIDTRIP